MRTSLSELKQARKAPRKGLEAYLHGLKGKRYRSSKIRGEWTIMAERICARADALQELSRQVLDEKLRHNARSFRRKKEVDDALLEEGLALVVVKARMALNLFPYEEQVAGAIGLSRGYLIEMATGEGKTLTLAMAAVLAAWSGVTCHILTANDYLAGRDAEGMSELYNSCGIAAVAVTGETSQPERKAAYRREVVYTTSKELVADLLRDQLQIGELRDLEGWRIESLRLGVPLDRVHCVLPTLDTVFVDEADNLLIDEAVTPLVISQNQKNESFNQAYGVVYDLASRLEIQKDYNIDSQFRKVELGQGVLDRIWDQVPREVLLLRNSRWLESLLKQALSAKEFYLKGKHYVVLDEKIVIVDQSTGRLMRQRTWGQGLHQLIETKEKLLLSDSSVTVASMSFQKFFRSVPNLAGVTGTVMESREELWSIYELPVVSVPTHRPIQRCFEKQRVFLSREEKYQAMISAISEVHQKNCPVLVGTQSIQGSQELASLLGSRGLDFELLNAEQHALEASIISKAGKAQAITVATNMAGRGTDIVLDPQAIQQGGLHVISSEYNTSARVDRQLYGRCARQGNPGSVFQFISLEDDIILNHLPGFLVTATRCIVERMPVLRNLAGVCLARLGQKRATKKHYRQRMDLLEQEFRHFQSNHI
jgi:preprotein translocase subunit SecA